jgi:hypothetical protein
MELDELKQTWKQASAKQHQSQNIMEMIRKKSSGPVAALKHSFKKQVQLVLVLMIAIALSNARNLDNAAANILFWTYIAFCLCLMTFFYFNYRRTTALENMDGDLKTYIENYVTNMERRINAQYVAVRFVGLFFVLLLEILPYFSHSRMLDKWHALSPVIRLSLYAAFFILQYVAGNRFRQRKFGTHLFRLRQLLKDLN